ncbi:hypothetical protein [Candidatus Kryptobacter tengchongensis]|uniref:Outer membrane protein beta-barrel domain-containing protein n=1 Tax=Kryptobacter tengchongensis TaxID=1643429 RepID=A0A916PCQ9_KRYT1|nr:hypothetical protein [Candidatus Kryptobacter tengchongensis]CUT05431.1 hypothetical protein JGI25_01583 [Candidatus Kryptobacter tengchongensis]
MNKLILAILVLFLFNISQAQFSIATEGIYIVPVGGFSGWFDNHYSGTIYIGQVNHGNSFISGRVEFYRFYRENTKKLFYKDLNLELKLYGVGAEYRYSILRFNFLNFHGIIGTGVYRWFGLRGEYFFKDSAGNVIDYIAERRYQDWSAGFWGGGGVEVRVMKNLSLNLSTRYQIVVGEMWQTLALRLEQASGFQWIGIQAGAQVRF